MFSMGYLMTGEEEEGRNGRLGKRELFPEGGGEVLLIKGCDLGRDILQQIQHLGKE
jgi:hypothetical protein